MAKRCKLRNPGRCPFCFREVGLTKNDLVPFHKVDGKRCGGTKLRGGRA